MPNQSQLFEVLIYALEKSQTQMRGQTGTGRGKLSKSCFATSLLRPFGWNQWLLGPREKSMK